MTSAFDIELREFIRRLGVNDDRLRLLERRSRALQQNIRDFGAFGGGTGVACATTLRGRAVGAKDEGIPNSVVRFVGTQTSNEYGSFTANDPESIADGAYLAVLYIADDDTDVDIYVTPPGDLADRFDPDTVARTYNFFRCNVTNDIDVLLVPASGYHYAGTVPYPGTDEDSACNLPIYDSLKLSDSFYGHTVTAVWVTNAIWEVCISGVAYPGASFGISGTCPSRTSIPIKYQVVYSDSLGQWYVQYYTDSAFIGGGPLAGCPVEGGTCAAAIDSYGGTGGTSTWTCPDPSTSTLFEFTKASAASFLHPPGSTIHVIEDL